MEYVLGREVLKHTAHMIVGELTDLSVAHTVCGQDLTLQIARTTVPICNECLTIAKANEQTIYVAGLNAHGGSTPNARNDD